MLYPSTGLKMLYGNREASSAVVLELKWMQKWLFWDDPM